MPTCPMCRAAPQFVPSHPLPSWRKKPRDSDYYASFALHELNPKVLEQLFLVKPNLPVQHIDCMIEAAYMRPHYISEVIIKQRASPNYHNLPETACLTRALPKYSDPKSQLGLLEINGISTETLLKFYSSIMKESSNDPVRIPVTKKLDQILMSKSREQVVGKYLLFASEALKGIVKVSSVEHLHDFLRVTWPGLLPHKIVSRVWSKHAASSKPGMMEELQQYMSRHGIVPNLYDTINALDQILKHVSTRRCENLLKFPVFAEDILTIKASRLLKNPLTRWTRGKKLVKVIRKIFGEVIIY